MRLPSEALWFRRMVDLRRSKPGHECGTGVRTFAAESQGQKLSSYRRRGAIGRQLSPICHVLLGISSRGTGAV